MNTVTINGEAIPVCAGQLWTHNGLVREIITIRYGQIAYWLEGDAYSSSLADWQASEDETIIRHSNGADIDLGKWCYLWPWRDILGQWREGLEYWNSNIDKWLVCERDSVLQFGRLYRSPRAQEPAEPTCPTCDGKGYTVNGDEMTRCYDCRPIYP